MATRRDFLQMMAGTALAGLPLVGQSRPQSEPEPPPDIFDAQTLDLEFWIKPRTISVIRPQSGEKARLTYWKDGEIIDAAYQELCHLLRDVNGKETAPIDPKLFETLWGAQAFVQRFGIESPLEILSGYRTPASNKKLIEQGIPAARQSLHMSGKAADIRIPNLNAEVLGSLVQFPAGRRGVLLPPGAAGRVDSCGYRAAAELERLEIRGRRRPGV